MAGSPYRSMCWSPNGRHLMVGGFQGALHGFIFDDSRKRLRRIPAAFPTEGTCTMWGVAFAGDGRRCAALDSNGLLRLWDFATPESSPVLAASRDLATEGIAVGRCVCMNNDGSIVYCAGDDGTVVAFRRVATELSWLWTQKPHADSVYTLRLVHDETHLLTCGLDARVSLLEAASGEYHSTPHDSSQPPRLSVIGLRVRGDLLEECDREFLARRGAKIEPPPVDAAAAPQAFEYDVAISVAEEDLRHADELERKLAAAGVRVFYYRNEMAKTWGEFLHERLHEVYARKARRCVPLTSKFYAQSSWARHELAAAKEREHEQSNYILRIRLDDTRIPGLPETHASVSISEGLDHIVAWLLSKLKEK